MSLARRAARRLRRDLASRLSPTPVADAGPTGADVTRVLASGIFDQPWYESQAGRTFDGERAAAKHYLRSGALRGFSPHPAFIADEPGRSSGRAALLAYLDARPARRAKITHPAWDVPAWVRMHPDAARHELGPVGHVLTWSGDPDVALVGSGHSDPEVPWSRVEAALRSAMATWDADRRRHRAVTARVAAPTDDEGVEPVTEGPLVTVVVPADGDGPAVRRRLESVRLQTYRSLDVVVVDDGSTVDLDAVVAAAARHDPRVRLVEAPDPEPAAGFAAGLAAARGDVVAFLDAGAVWNPEFCGRAVATLLRDDAALVAAATQVRNAEGETRYLGAPVEHADLLDAPGLDLAAVLARRDLLERVGGPDPALGEGAAYDLLLRLSREATPRWVPVVGAHRTDVKAHLPWTQHVRTRHLAPPSAADGTLAAVVPTRGGLARVRSMLPGLLADERSVRVAVVDLGGVRDDWLALAVLEATDARVRVVRAPRRASWGLAATLALADLPARRALLLDPEVVLDAEAVDALVAALEQGAAMSVPVTVEGRDTVVAAGAVLHRASGLPSDLLVGHARGALDAVDADPVVLATGSGRTVGIDVEALASVGGFDLRVGDELVVADLGLRLGAAGRRTVLARDGEARLEGRLSWSRSTIASRELFADRHRGSAPAGLDWPDLGLHVASWGAGDTRVPWRSLPFPAPVLSDGPVDDAADRTLRWAVHLCADPSQDHEHRRLAEALRHGLVARGHRVTVSGPPVARPAAGLDDVTLVIGDGPVPDPDPFRPSLLWVVGAAVPLDHLPLARFDAVCVGSRPWQEQVAAHGVEASLLRWPALPSSANLADVDLLVRGARVDTLRRLGDAARAAGLSVDATGDGWDTEELGTGARWTLVASRHRDRLHGFWPHGVLEVLASGGQPVAGPTADLDPRLAAAVAEFSSPAGLLDVVTSPPAPADEAVRAWVRDELGLDATLDRLVELAQAARARRAAG